MTPERRRMASAFALATLALVIMLGVRPVPAERIVAGYVLALAAIGLAALTRALTSAGEDQPPSELERMLARSREEPSRPPELIRIEREITLGSSSAGGLHLRLLPLLREIAAARLRLDLERRPDRARALLGDEAWELLRPDRAPPADRTAPGLSLRRVRTLVDTLERL